MPTVRACAVHVVNVNVVMKTLMECACLPRMTVAVVEYVTAFCTTFGYVRRDGF